jgi:undecaprenyl-diphosphatase
MATLAALAATSRWVSAGGLARVDRDGLILAHAWRSPWLDVAFMTLTWIGSLTLLLPLVLGVGILLWSQGRRVEALFLAAALGGAAVLVELAKNLALRPRPDMFPPLAPVVSPFSFPSGHALQATAVAAALLLVVWRDAPRRGRWAAGLLAALVALVCVSRLYLQVHYPSDALAGVVAAMGWVAGLQALMSARSSAPPT